MKSLKKVGVLQLEVESTAVWAKRKTWSPRSAADAPDYDEAEDAPHYKRLATLSEETLIVGYACTTGAAALHTSVLW